MRLRSSSATELPFPAVPYKRQNCQILPCKAEVAASWVQLSAKSPGEATQIPPPLERPLHHHRHAARLVAGVEDHENLGGGLGGGEGLIPSRVEDEVIPEGSQPLAGG